MRISELAVETGVSVSTLKFYLRERLMAPGEPISATQSSYGADHVQRVRLIRALTEVGGLSVASCRQILEALANPPEEIGDLLSAAHRALPGLGADQPESESVRSFIKALGWRVGSQSPARRSLSAAVQAAQDAGVPMPAEAVDAYAKASMTIAEADVTVLLREPDVEHMLQLMAVGTVMNDAILSALRRLAQEHIGASLLAGVDPFEEARLKEQAAAALPRLDAADERA